MTAPRHCITVREAVRAARSVGLHVRVNRSHVFIESGRGQSVSLAPRHARHPEVDRRVLGKLRRIGVPV